MTIELIKRLLDACYEAKRIRDMLPAAAGRRDTILYPFSGCHRTDGNKRNFRKVSDISDALNLPRPGGRER